ncbi:DUF4376 domain-containing protein [Salipiger mangrovisoli]|uniref:DUF4376 domain-containing protein n=1 Tax=Salipiger mangrovisoli TaxID=2865933 RepID=A0ABR9WX27_9RHOB|nr:DUF4376 domain-containing protein [Salipiger mangrovisoli]MBE9635786.1 DUF4376 domain-containing protein [Salipiger mangrovisoli]
MLLYYDTETGQGLYAMQPPKDAPRPEGAYVELGDVPAPANLHLLRVDLDTLELEVVIPPVTAEDVTAERDRRINGGFTFGGVAYQTRPEDRENMAGASTAALSAIMNGAQVGDVYWHGGATPFSWIAQDNTLTEMDAQTMFAFGQAAMEHKQAHIFAAREIKDMDPIPQDFADDSRWPA